LTINRFTNTDPIRVNGVEFQTTQNTDFLDGFWGNFGGTFNYSDFECAAKILSYLNPWKLTPPFGGVFYR